MRTARQVRAKRDEFRARIAEELERYGGDDDAAYWSGGAYQAMTLAENTLTWVLDEED